MFTEKKLKYLYLNYIYNASLKIPLGGKIWIDKEGNLLCIS